MFIESANHPMFLRTGLPAIDQALNGGINYGGITEVCAPSLLLALSESASACRLDGRIGNAMIRLRAVVRWDSRDRQKPTHDDTQCAVRDGVPRRHRSVFRHGAQL